LTTRSGAPQDHASRQLKTQFNTCMEDFPKVVENCLHTSAFIIAGYRKK
jgi:hypothetical protein